MVPDHYDGDNYCDYDDYDDENDQHPDKHLDLVVKSTTRTRPAGPRWIVGRVRFSWVNFSCLASRLRRSASRGHDPTSGSNLTDYPEWPLRCLDYLEFVCKKGDNSHVIQRANIICTLRLAFSTLTSWVLAESPECILEVIFWVLETVDFKVLQHFPCHLVTWLFLHKVVKSWEVKNPSVVLVNVVDHVLQCLKSNPNR